MSVPDRAAREAALDVRRSFIVQAPAGAGKTELLIQRLLSLLAVVDAPSQILAITFTRKAAGEMRTRLIEALTEAAESSEPDTSPSRERWRLARRVLARDAERGWALRERFDALTIETFDALCSRIARAGWLPDAQDETAWADIDEDLTPLYREAARAAVEALDEPGFAGEGADLLDRMDNRVPLLVDGIADLLARRGQWAQDALDESPAGTAAQDRLIERLIERGLRRLAGSWTAEELETARECATTALAHLDAGHKLRPALAPLANGPAPRAVIDDLPAWHALARLMLTDQGEWRKAVDARMGLPPTAKVAKARLIALCDARRERDATGYEARLLASALVWPDRAALAEHARVRSTLQRLLKRALAELKIRLDARGVTDFGGMALAAQWALDANAHGVAERLDARFAHILVDEFQDTSPAQARLLESLVAEWSPGDGRTLFLVGDPMQSIYAFRDADVGIFLAAMRKGIGPLRPEVLTLSANFRSRPALVEWVNRIAPLAFARAANSARFSAADEEAIPFSAATAVRPTEEGTGASLHGFDTAEDEAKWIAGEIERLRAEQPGERIAVIVRRRQDAAALLAEFARRAMPVKAVEFAELATRPVVNDLLALAELLVQPTDRHAFVAWLRSPLVGLRLVSIAEVAHAGDVLLDADRRPALIARLTVEEAARLAQALTAFDAAVAERQMRPLSEVVWRCFLRLGGEALVRSADDRDDAEVFLELVDQVAPRGLLEERIDLHRRLEALRRTVLAGSDASAVEILTIHKAKGLEWDTVFLPGLDRAGGRPGFEPLVWVIDRGAQAAHGGHLIIAARERRRSDSATVFSFVRDLRDARHEEEAARLLYVAVTRARERLYLSCALGSSVRTDTLAGLIGWNATAPKDGREADDAAPPAELQAASRITTHSLARIVGRAHTRVQNLLESSTIARASASSAVTSSSSAMASAMVESHQDVAVVVERAIGVAGHRLLEAFSRVAAGRKGTPPTTQPDVSAIEALLRHEGVPDDRASGLAQRLGAHLARLQEESIHWQFLFSSEHEEAAAELDLVHEGRALRVDRTFVTRAGERWLVDYKFGEPPGAADLAAWLADLQSRHAEQIARYARAVRAMDPRPLRCAIYVVWMDQLIPLS